MQLLPTHHVTYWIEALVVEFRVAVMRIGTIPLTAAPLVGLLTTSEGLSVSGRTAGEVADAAEVPA